ERHQDLAVGAELEDRVAFAVAARLIGRPDIALPVDMEAMRAIDQAGAEARNELAVLVELHDRIESRIDAVVAGAAVVRPDALAIGIDLNADGRAPLASLR